MYAYIIMVNVYPSSLYQITDPFMGSTYTSYLCYPQRVTNNGFDHAIVRTCCSG